MSDPGNSKRATEFKRLLERLDKLTPESESLSDAVGSSRPPSLPEPHVRGPGDFVPSAPMQPPLAWLQPQFPAQPQIQQGQSVGPWVFVLATILNTAVAAVLAVFITLGVMRPEQGPGQGMQQRLSNVRDGPAYDASSTSPRTAAIAVPAPSIAVRLAPIGSRETPLAVEPRQPSAFPLRIDPEEARREAYILVLTGLPNGSEINGAERISSDTWLLGPGTATGLEIILPERTAAALEIVIELRRTNGTSAATTRAWLATGAPATARAVDFDEVAARQLLTQGNQLLSRGDIVAARTLYERATERGSGEAALMLGSTYDPNRLWALGVFGMVGNKVRAKQWYQRAVELGHPQAKDRIGLLGD